MLDEIDVSATAWQQRASCAGLSAIFIDGTRPEPDELETVVRICARCPVRAECGDYATREDVKWGIWAGIWRGAVKYRKPVAA